jgi:hypothetical protein
MMSKLCLVKNLKGLIYGLTYKQELAIGITRRALRFIVEFEGSNSI